jgi:hypothetical protein
LEKWPFFDTIQKGGSMEKEKQSGPQTGEDLAPVQEPPLPSEAHPPEEPILLNKLFPDAKHDLDSLFPDTQMKHLLRELYRTRQKNQRFLKRLNLSKIDDEGNNFDPDSR